MSKSRLARSILILALVSADACPAFAHPGEPNGDRFAGPRNVAELWHTWGREPGVLIPLALSASWYALGLRRLWRDGHRGRGVQTWEALCFGGGWLALAVALVSPLHPMGSVLFSAHMGQHEILMLVAAPLLVLGRPVVAFLKALPRTWAQALARWSNFPRWRIVWGALTAPLFAWAVHAVILWIWHIPALFDATLDDNFIHALQHISFLGSAILFWWALVQTGRTVMSYGAAVLYVFTTA